MRPSTLEEYWQFYFSSLIWECLPVFCKNGSAHSSSPQTHKVGDDGLLSRVRTRQQEEVNAFGSRCQLSMASWESGHCRQGLCSNHCPVLPVRHRRKPLSLPNNSSSHSPFFSLSLSSLSFSSSSSSSFCSSSSLLLSFLVCFRCLANLESRRVRRSMWSAYQAHIIKEN